MYNTGNGVLTFSTDMLGHCTLHYNTATHAPVSSTFSNHKTQSEILEYHKNRPFKWNIHVSIQMNTTTLTALCAPEIELH